MKLPRINSPSQVLGHWQGRPARVVPASTPKPTQEDIRKELRDTFEKCEERGSRYLKCRMDGNGDTYCKTITGITGPISSWNCYSALQAMEKYKQYVPKDD